MPGFSSTTSFYNSWKEQIGKTANLSSDVFKILLVDNSYTPDAAAHSILSDVTGEISGGGYARQTLAGVTFLLSGSTAKFDFDDVVFSATGGDFTARRFVIYDDTVASPVKPLVCFGLLNSANSDVTVTDGNTLTLQTPAGGLFSVG